MNSNFEVRLRPMTTVKRIGNLTVQQDCKQDYVDIFTPDGRGQTWGYCPHGKGRGTFLPLSGFPKELVGEVQRQINLLRGYPEGEGPAPPVMVETGRTAAEQEADFISDHEEDEAYE
jgi:hypothetical protein